MKKPLLALLISAILASVSFAALRADSTPGAVESRTPVMIIRFNQRTVNFEKHLSTVVQRAMQKKQDVVFDVVGLVPLSSSDKTASAAIANLSRVVGAFHANGVPDNQIAVSHQESQVATDEVYIFVR